MPSLALTHPVVQSELGLAILLPQRLKSVDERVLSGGPQVDTVMIILYGGKAETSRKQEARSWVTKLSLGPLSLVERQCHLWLWGVRKPRHKL